MAQPSLSVPAGTIMFRPDDPCSGYVVVRSGSIRVVLTAENGREIVLYRVRPGDVCLQTFSCLVDHRHYSAEGIAETDLEADIIPPPEFDRRMADDAAFRNQLFAAVAQRFADLEQLVEDVALTGFEARLARLLLRLADPAGRVEATHESLAAEAGSGRAVVTRQLGRFARDGLVSMTRGQLQILDRAALEILSHEM
ncbi:Crp/Fnr family transcriptional regulator [Sphingomonas lacunae]|uniref:Crp/Fnr family transcriptional regulator n=1 Tax=Sphingomonas lacunae TaxID=2698828 RepID=A0A6M4ATG6_9SPHN|nr:Crp/Fnr family transcriptional regulator [Sphingomonas lacunae]QJQ32016.1 Crp/Fnr family transcriptional regulator [Sphingomonas lacunae]